MMSNGTTELGDYNLLYKLSPINKLENTKKLQLHMVPNSNFMDGAFLSKLLQWIGFRSAKLVDKEGRRFSDCCYWL